MKKFLFLMSLLFSLAAEGNDWHLRDAVVKVNGSAVEKEGTYLFHGSGSICFDGKWDLSKCKSLNFNVTNNSKDSWITIWICVFDSNSKETNLAPIPQRHQLQYFRRIAPSTTEEVQMMLPADLADSELDSKISLMRSSPVSLDYGLLGFLTNLKDIRRVRIGVSAMEGVSEWILSPVTCKEGKRKAKAWMKKKSSEFFPFVDCYGQLKYREWKGKIHCDKDLMSAREAEVKDLKEHPGPSSWSKFGGWKKGPRYEATGHFRIEKIDGKWWMVDPEGYLYWAHGIVRVSPSCAVTPLDGRKFYFEGLPTDVSDPLYHFYSTYDELLRPYYTARGIKETYDFSRANEYRKYGGDYYKIFSELCHKRLRSWGLNLMANSSDHAICHMDRTPYNERVDLGSPIVGYPEWPILEGSTGWWKFIDPFDPIFETCVRAHLETERFALDDPWCIGLFVDNEIDWINDSHFGRLVAKASPRQAAKQAFMNHLIAKYHNIEALNKVWTTSFADWNAFLQNRKAVPSQADTDLKEMTIQIAHRYFATIRKVFKEMAPHKLYLGCRFASAPEGIVVVGAQYCDVMSYNIYQYSLADFRLPRNLDKPVMVGEFHFGSLDRGMPYHSLRYVNNQEDRGRAYEHYLRTALRNPLIIGTNWHQFSDQPATGRFDGESFQVGFTDVCDTPYYETIAHSRIIGEERYEIRSK